MISIKNNTNNIFVYLLHCVIIFFLLLFSLRNSGLDYQAYYLEFVDPNNYSSSSEFGYVILLDIIRHIGDFEIVIFISNLICYLGHYKIINKCNSPFKMMVFLIYFIYLTFFLILGSPRRLIAYSIIVPIVFSYFNSSIKVNSVIRVFIAGLFHTSSLILLPFVAVYVYGFKRLFRLKYIIVVIVSVFLIFWMLYSAGIYDSILLKLDYYYIHAAKEQEYLKEVPSVYTGLVKRLVVFSIIFILTKTWVDAKKIQVLCLTEISIYFFFGLFSPILSVLANYFSIVYILPFFSFNYKRTPILNRFFLLLGAIMYYLPTVIGLIRMFGDLYV